jgi:hypothetical protein
MTPLSPVHSFRSFIASEEGRPLHARRGGIEGTLSHGCGHTARVERDTAAQRRRTGNSDTQEFLDRSNRPGNSDTHEFPRIRRSEQSTSGSPLEGLRCSEAGRIDTTVVCTRSLDVAKLTGSPRRDGTGQRVERARRRLYLSGECPLTARRRSETGEQSGVISFFALKLA